MISLTFSLYLWGIIRTAFWLIPTLIFPEIGPIVSSGLLSFWLLMSWLGHYEEEHFDFNRLSKSQVPLVLISTGLLGGSLIDPYSYPVFGYASLAPLASLALFFIAKHPATSIVYLPKRTRWILLCLWIFCAALRVFENQFRIVIDS